MAKVSFQIQFSIFKPIFNCLCCVYIGLLPVQGKTFALTMEYFKIVFNVTFTNKATEDEIPYRAGIEP